MKKSLVALAVFGAFSGMAYADGGSVTMFGIIDAGFMTASKTAGGANGQNQGGSVTAFQDAQILPSIYGIKGSEDIGSGVKVGFNLEGGFDTHNGEHNSPGVVQSQIFGREAKVTLGADWGTFAAGLQVDPALVAAIATEPRGMTDSLSSLEYWIIATVGNGPAASGGLTGGIFDQNAISYSYSGSGLYIGAIYSFGGVAGSTAARSGASIGASYTNSGFTISAGYAENKADIAAVAATATTPATPAYTGTSSQIDFVGLGYAIDAFAVRVQYQEFKTGYNYTGTNADDVKDIGIGLDWKVAANTLNLSYYNAKDDGAHLGGKTTEIALLDTYGLSKRTSVYAQLASVKSDAIVAGTSGPGDTAVLGGIYTPVGLFNATDATTTFFGVGIQHSF